LFISGKGDRDTVGCTPFDAILQQCFWRDNCTKAEDRNKSATNETWYLAGWRSKWDEKKQHRKVEVYCCKSPGLKMIFCNLTKNYTDADTSLVLSRPSFKYNVFMKPKAFDGQIIRDMDHWYIKE
jgi:hypothetical protein